MTTVNSQTIDEIRLSFAYYFISNLIKTVFTLMKLMSSLMSKASTNQVHSR